jgi:hypothetical protein
MVTANMKKIFMNQRGSVINVALLILILIFLVGIVLHRISTTDIKIASNIKTDTTTFYETEAGLDAASELLEQNIACPTGFADTDDTTDNLRTGWEIIEGQVMVKNLRFWRNRRAGDTAIDRDDTTFSSAAAGNPTRADEYPDIDAYYPPDFDPSTDPDAPLTTMSIGGAARFSKGSAIQMAAGYEGLGKGAGAGGASIIYDVYVRRYGLDNSEALHTIEWVHKLGFGGTCQY